MSNEALTWVFEHSRSRAGSRLILLSLADRADDSGRCWPSLADIRRRAGIATRRAVEKGLRKLVAIKELEIEAGGGRGHTNTYTILMPVAKELAETPSGAQGFRPGGNGDGTDKTPSGAQGFRPGGNGDGTDKTPSAAHRNPVRRAPKPRPARTETPSGAHPEPTEPTVNPKDNPQGREALSAETVPAAAVDLLKAAAIRVADPELAAFQELVSERRAVGRRDEGGRVGKLIGGSALAYPGARANGARRPRGRLPEAEQAATFTLLTRLPGLDEADARDLATIAPRAEFERVLRLMPAKPRNCGGWLRRAVTENWAGRTANGVEERPCRSEVTPS